MNKIILRIVLLILFSTVVSIAQVNPLEKILNENKDKFGHVIENPDSFEVQIIYTQINRDKNNFPKLTTHKYNVNPKNYFYPASTVKLPLAILALEKLNSLKIAGLNKFTPIRIDSNVVKQSCLFADTSSVIGIPSIAHLIKKLFLVSDNDSYNYLYEFLGQKGINKTLHNKGYKDVKIVHRFVSGLSAEENSRTNTVDFYSGEKIIYHQPSLINTEEYPTALNKLQKGIGYLNAKDSLVNKPFDFSQKNYISLETLTDLLKAIIFPEAVPAKMRFNLTSDDYKFLYKYMSMFPRESKYPGYDTSHYDGYVKYFLFGDSHKKAQGNIRSFDKVGLAYGYLTDIAYIIDFKNKIEFMLSATILVNKDGIFNDNKYEYNQIGLPFLANLGRAVYNYELNRTKNHLPDLSKFNINYVSE